MHYRPQDIRIGVLGGGQLGKMLFEKSLSLDLLLHFMDTTKDCSVGKICCNFIEGDLQSFEDVMNFGKDQEVVTIEIEHVNIEALTQLESLGVKVYPQASVLRLIQDKGLQKQFLIDNNFSTAPFKLFDSKDQIETAVRNKKLSFPFVQKIRKGGYDGRGVCIVRSANDLNHLLDGPSVIEELADIDKELSIIAVRSSTGEIKTYPSVSMEFHPTANLVEYLICPSGILKDIEDQIQLLAYKITEKLNIVGLLAIEMFLNKDGTVWINEMAPRPHNSGHHTLNNGAVSQFENHLRAITGLPLGITHGNQVAIMMNLLGASGFSGPVDYKGIDKLLTKEGIHPYLYGKSETREFRKMGHVTITDISTEECIAKYNEIKDLIQIISSDND